MPILDADGEIREWFGTATDVTELHEATRALHEAEQRQQVLISGVPQLVWRADAAGEWTWASPQWSEFTGQAEPESHGTGWLKSVHPDDRALAKTAWTKADEDDGFDVEYRILQASDGTYRWFQTRATPVRNDDGVVVEWLGTSTDVDSMRLLNKRQEVLVAELQHRVRNMLTVIRSVFAQTVNSGGELEDVADHFKGNLIGHCDQNDPVASSTIVGITDVDTCIAPEASASPALAKAYAMSRALEESDLLAQIARLGRMNAQEKVADLLLELLGRLRLAGLADDGRYKMPLTQEVLADAVGLTSVHVNRMLQALRREGSVDWKGRELIIHDPITLARNIGRPATRVSAA